MAAITKNFDLDYALAPFGASKSPAIKTAVAPARSFWARFMQSLIESRMKSAERELRRHSHLLIRLDADKQTVERKDLPF